MATGVPKAPQQKADRILQSESQQACGAASAALVYEGKRPESAILATRPAQVVQLWCNPQQPGDTNRNQLYFGDNLPILAHLLQNPMVRGQVRLVYIDPPFATKSIFQSRSQTDAYSDLLSGAHYIEFLRQRLVLLRELLADDGSIYVHLDENMAFYIKVIMDEVFGAQNYRNWITRKKCNPKNYTRKTYGNISDFILFYSKSACYVWNRPFEHWTPERAQKEYQYVEDGSGRRYKKVPLHAPGVRNGETGQPWRGIKPPPGKHWQFPPRVLDEMDQRGEVYWSPNANPRRKIYLDDSDGVPVQDIWLDFRDAHNQNIEITGYPTEKNPNLLKRIIDASSNPGDLVLDCFAGSGTTLAVASQLGRRWIGVDSSVSAIAATLRRFVKGLERMGDFVERIRPEQNEARAETLPLCADFGKGAPSTTPGTPGRANQITDFALFAVEPYRGELDALVEQCLRSVAADPIEEAS
jgi:adenine-specific DNA-methyltransferase